MDDAIVCLPDLRLRDRSERVDAADPQVDALAKRMFRTLASARGIGLAAIQIGVPKRVIVIDIRSRSNPEESEAPGAEAAEPHPFYTLDDPGPIVLVNPELESVSSVTIEWEEGCLSIPAVYETIRRPTQCRIRYQDLQGTTHTRACQGMFARCVQHELDHLDGKLILDHLSRLKRMRIMKRIEKAARVA